MHIPTLTITDPHEALTLLVSNYPNPDTPPGRCDGAGTYQWHRFQLCEVVAGAVTAASRTGDPNARGSTNWIVPAGWLQEHTFGAADTIESLTAAWDAGIMW